MPHGRSPSPTLPPTAPFGWALAGAILYAAAFPPIDLPWLAWLAPIPWLRLALADQLAGKRPYVMIWLASGVTWLWLLQGIRLAHPALYLGWLALSLYTAVYLPLFVAAVRIAMQRGGAPLVVAAPIAWMGLEVIRAYFLTGIAIGLLGHSQTGTPLLLQIADLGGGYAVGFVIVAWGAGITAVLAPHVGWQRAASRTVGNWSLAAGLLTTACAVIYGWVALRSPPVADNRPPLRIVLVQGALDTVFEMSADRARQIIDHYRELSLPIAREHPQVELVIWPESSCPAPYVLPTDRVLPPPGMTVSETILRENLEESRRAMRRFLGEVADSLRGEDASRTAPALIFGGTSYAYDTSPPRMYNTAFHSDSQGNIAAVYHKMHPVMFGEYIPLADWFPILYRITPLPTGIARGDGPRTFRVGDYRLAPSICFEDTVPHLIQRQVAELRQQGEEPDVLVNVTNDGWFWGSAILDLHYRCAVLRAVELRKPLVVAANTGLSTAVDGNGRALVIGKRRTPQRLVVEIRADGRRSLYARYGDIFGGLCALAVGLTLLWEWGLRWQERVTGEPNSRGSLREPTPFETRLP